jgi:twitching motility protein PilT
MARIDAFLKLGTDQGCSDIHFAVGVPPMLRMHGDLLPIKFRDLSQAELEGYIAEITSRAHQDQLRRGYDVDFSYVAAHGGRFRVNVFRKETGIGATFRAIPSEVPSLDRLGLPPIVKRLCDHHQGMILVTGSTGTGKSTTLAAMIDKINRERAGHIITVEDPIEFIHKHQRCIVNQREVGTDTKSFASALKYALREDPDVILVGELRDLETIASALTIAETGHLALATLHTNSAPEAINRIIDVFPSNQQSQVRAQLAFVLEGIVTQTLLPRASGRGRAMAAEIMVATPAIRAVIRDDKVHQIYSLMQAGKKHGMQTMIDALYQLYMNREITREEALRVAPNQAEFLRAIGETPVEEQTLAVMGGR